MYIVGMVIVGLIAGALARLIMPGKDPMGILMTIILGVAGSFVGGFAATLIRPSETGDFRPAGILLSIVGALLLLFLWRMIRSRSAS